MPLIRSQSDHAMQSIYANYMHAHQDFTTYQARKRIAWSKNSDQKIIDLSNADAFTYDALVNLIDTAIPNKKALAHRISEEINSIQNQRVELKRYNFNFGKTATLTDKINKADDVISKCVTLAKDLITTIHRLPTKFRENGDWERVNNMAQNIKRQEQDLRKTARLLASDVQGPHCVKVVPQKKQRRRTSASVLTLNELYKALLDNIEGSLGKVYEALLGFLMGELGDEVTDVLLQQLRDWGTDGVKYRSSARGSLNVWGTIDNVIPHEDPSQSTPLTKKAKGTLIDWYIERKSLTGGFTIRIPVSQKMYLDAKGTGELEIKGIQSGIQSKVLQVSKNIPQAYALFRAFASPSSRGSKHLEAQNKSLAEAIVKDTLFDDIFGSTVDSVSDILINRVFYSADAVMNKILANPYRTTMGKQRINIHIATSGTDSSGDANVNLARQTEAGAAGVWVSNARLRKIQQSSFIVHWYFETKWFDGSVVEQF